MSRPQFELRVCVLSCFVQAVRFARFRTHLILTPVTFFPRFTSVICFSVLGIFGSNCFIFPLTWHQFHVHTLFRYPFLVEVISNTFSFTWPSRQDMLLHAGKQEKITKGICKQLKAKSKEIHVCSKDLSEAISLLL